MISDADFYANARPGRAPGPAPASPPQRTRELDRILAIPRRPQPLDPGVVVPDLTREFRRLGGTMSLRPAQSAALADATKRQGLMAVIRAGGGKTLVSLLLAQAVGARRAILLVPSQVRPQTLADVKRYAASFKIPRVRLIDEVNRREDGVLVLATYEQLSSPRLGKLLETIDPDVIVADEVHRIARRGSVRSRRFLKFMKEKPHVRFFGLSGTATKRSIREYNKLLELALGDYSPLPRGVHEIDKWAAVLDAGADDGVDPGALVLLCGSEITRPPLDGDEKSAQARTYALAAVRAGFRSRLRETEGVIMSAEADVACSLHLRARRPRMPDEVKHAIATTMESWQRPDGEEIEDPMRLAATVSELALGFYYIWDWPGGVVDHEWLKARAAWHKNLREFLQRQGDLVDFSPANATKLAKLAWSRGGPPPESWPAWPAWAAVADCPQPPTKPVWVSRFAVGDALLWSQEVKAAGERGVIWYRDQAIGEALGAAGLRVFGAGVSDELVAGLESRKLPDVIACSIRAHATGKNFQHCYSRGLVVGFPGDGALAEQLIARIHREGQPADEVVFDIHAHHERLTDALDKATIEARYVEQTQGAAQRLCYATREGFDRCGS